MRSFAESVGKLLLTTAIVFLASSTGWYAIILQGNFEYYFQYFAVIWRGKGGEYAAFIFWFSIMTTVICVPLLYVGMWLLKRLDHTRHK